MKVELSTVGNPDYGQNPDQELWGCIVRSAKVEVNSFEHASQLCRQFIEMNELGGGNWSGGDIFDDKGKRIAYVSYNGRVWNVEDGKRWHESKKEIKLDFEKNKIDKTTFKLVSCTGDDFLYQDDKGRKLSFRGKGYNKQLDSYTKFSLLSYTHDDFKSGQILDMFIDRWSWGTIKQKTKQVEKVEFYI